jgi:transposase
VEDAGIKPGTVASDVLGASGRAMLDGLVAGTNDPAVLAELAKGRLRAKPPALGEALEGRFRAHHALLPGELLAHLDHLDEAVERLSTQVARVVAPCSPLLALLITIPGVSQRTAEVLLAEIGIDVGQVPSAGHLASWAGICPGNYESAGKHRTTTTRKGSKGSRWLRVALIEAANAAARGEGTYLASQYARLKGRRGHKRAIVAVAHSVLVIAWHLLSTGQPDSDLGADWFPQRHASEAYRNRLVRQLERMGHKVTLEPADAA